MKKKEKILSLDDKWLQAPHTMKIWGRHKKLECGKKKCWELVFFSLKKYYARQGVAIYEIVCKMFPFFSSSFDIYSYTRQGTSVTLLCAILFSSSSVFVSSSLSEIFIAQWQFLRRQLPRSVCTAWYSALIEMKFKSSTKRSFMFLFKNMREGFMRDNGSYPVDVLLLIGLEEKVIGSTWNLIIFLL